MATYLAERGARHITLLSRSVIPPRSRWPALAEDDPHFATVTTLRAIERLGVQITTASVDVADEGQVTAWLSKHVARRRQAGTRHRACRRVGQRSITREHE